MIFYCDVCMICHCDTYVILSISWLLGTTPSPPEKIDYTRLRGSGSGREVQPNPWWNTLLPCTADEQRDQSMPSNCDAIPSGTVHRSDVVVSWSIFDDRKREQCLSMMTHITTLMRIVTCACNEATGVPNSGQDDQPNSPFNSHRNRNISRKLHAHASVHSAATSDSCAYLFRDLLVHVDCSLLLQTYNYQCMELSYEIRRVSVASTKGAELGTLFHLLLSGLCDGICVIHNMSILLSHEELRGWYSVDGTSGGAGGGAGGSMDSTTTEGMLLNRCLESTERVTSELEEVHRQHDGCALMGSDEASFLLMVRRRVLDVLTRRVQESNPLQLTYGTHSIGSTTPAPIWHREASQHIGGTKSQQLFTTVPYYARQKAE